MKTYIRRREKNRELVVLYGGWGTDENLFVPLCSDKFDFILFYDYSADEALLLPETKTYDKIILIGWSLGVWAAQYLSAKTGIIPDLKIAVNGTSFPADDRYGIPLKVIEGTLNKMSEKTMEKYFRRMLGSRKSFQAKMERLPRRTVKSLQDELRWLYNRIMEQTDQNFNWNYAVISENDRVFPVKSQMNYWSGHSETKSVVLPMNHYLFDNWENYVCFIRDIETWEPHAGRRKRRQL